MDEQATLIVVGICQYRTIPFVEDLDGNLSMFYNPFNTI